MKKIEQILSVLLAVLLALLVIDLIKDDGQTDQKQRQEKNYVQYRLTSNKENLPLLFDTRAIGRNPSVKNQGALGTCWAIAASSAMEAQFLPEEKLVFAADHISLQNHFSKTQNDGGDYTMVMAYLAGWQGPVLEADDPYGDGVSDETLLPVKHVQEMQIVKNKDYEAIKQAVYQYGAVQTSIYMDLQNSFASSVYYNQLEYSYYYDGPEKSNHDILIIGWDDNYDASHFNRSTAQNGAFICQNSWGEEFGDQGIFYVSYADVNIGNNSIIYTNIEETDNYDHIYQTDDCGWVGQLGYGDGSCWFSNVYMAEKTESLQAVGFYSVGKNTEYEIYVLRNFKDFSAFQKDAPVLTGKLEQIGYYTVEIPEPVDIEENEHYAIVVHINTPDEKYPVASEYVSDEATENVTISDGEGYISHNGLIWTRTEEEHACNVCLKAYTNNR